MCTSKSMDNYEKCANNIFKFDINFRSERMNKPIQNCNCFNNYYQVKNINFIMRKQIKTNDTEYQRLAVRTHFIECGEDYIKLIQKYVQPIYKQGDIVAISEKIIAMCQNQVVKKSNIKLGFWSKVLSLFATSNSHGIGMDEPYKLQIAIDMKGLPRILLACMGCVVGRIFGKRGIFYRIAGQDVAGIDGLYSLSPFKEYHSMAVLLPKNSYGVCAEIYNKLGISCMIADANDLNVEILACSEDLEGVSTKNKVDLIRDNPAGQSDELTPFIIIRKVEDDYKNKKTA